MRAKHEPFFVMRVGRDLKSARYGYGVALQTAPTRGVRMPADYTYIQVVQNTHGRS